MPSPYTQDLFAAMSADGRIQPQVYYLEMSAPDTYWGQVILPHYAQVLPGTWFHFLGARMHVNLGAIRRLKQSCADLYVVAGYSGVTSQAVMHWLRMSGRPWVFWGELPGMCQRAFLSRTLRCIAQRPAVRWPNAIAAIGSRAVDAYRRLAPQSCRPYNIPYSCDMRPFYDIVRQPRLPSDQVRLLYCGQLIKRKGVDTLIRSFVRVADRRKNVSLTLVGSGPLQQELEASVPQRIKDRIHFAGFEAPERLPRYFATADVFVLPSRHDGWGVVINQAIASGLPVVCTDTVGASADLVQEGENGHIVHAENEDQLAKMLGELVDDVQRRERFGSRSRELAARWTPERSVGRWYELCSHVLKKRKQGRVTGA